MILFKIITKASTMIAPLSNIADMMKIFMDKSIIDKPMNLRSSIASKNKYDAMKKEIIPGTRSIRRNIIYFI